MSSIRLGAYAVDGVLVAGVVGPQGAASLDSDLGKVLGLDVVASDREVVGDSGSIVSHSQGIVVWVANLLVRGQMSLKGQDSLHLIIKSVMAEI